MNKILRLFIILLPLADSKLPSGDHGSKQVARPNIVLILTDDQDLQLGSLEAMPKLKKIITDNGVKFDNMFVTTPICCCSRSTIISGRYIHNNGAINNSLSGGCNSEYWRKKIEPTAFPALLKKAGYKTFYSGKYLNMYGFNNAGGPGHIPPGWDWWNGHINSPMYFDYHMSINGTYTHFGKRVEDYLTTVMLNQAREFLKSVDSRQPFFMMLAPTAPHTPAKTIPPYYHVFADRHAPRTPHFGIHSSDKHWVIRNMPETLDDAVTERIDDLFKKRWRSLQPVDDMIEDIFKTLLKRDLIGNTNIIYTSDNGFQLGQFNLPWDKCHLYEFDLRVPLMIRGPGIPRGITRKEPVLNLDLAPTVLSLANIPIPEYLEGLSFKKLLKSEQSNHDESWRKSFLVEYYGKADGKRTCGDGLGSCIMDCICIDAINNTYDCIRTLSKMDGTDDIFCELKDNENFIEYYDLRKDPYQLENQFKALSESKVADFKKQLSKLKQCIGRSCRQ